MSNIKFDSERDLRLIPFLPLTDGDDLEVRIQLSAEKPIDTEVSVYLDDTSEKSLLHTEHVSLGKSYSLIKLRHKLNGLMGDHKLIITADGEMLGEKVFNVLPRNNHIDGGFVILGGAENSSVTSVFGDTIPNLTDKEWSTLMDEYNELGFKCIIVQMSVGIIDFSDNSLGAYYKSSLFPRANIKANDPIGSILAACERNGQSVLLGMCSPLFKGDSGITSKIVNELYSLYGHYSSLYGWYSSWEFGITNEVDDDFRLSVQSKEIRALRDIVDSISPVMPIMYSPFTTSYTNNRNHKIGVSASVIEAIADGSLPFDILAPHDHCGQVHKLTNQSMTKLEDAVKIYATLKRACDISGVHLWANCEGFNFEFKPSLSEQSYYHYDNVFTPRHIGGNIDGESGLAAHATLLKPYAERVISFMITGIFQKPDSKVRIGNRSCEENYLCYSEYISSENYSYENLAHGKKYTLTADRLLAEPDNGYTFYNEFVCGAEKVLHPDKEEGGLLTDGLMSGAQTDGSDTYLSLGYMLEHYGDTCRAEAVIDLENIERVDKVRCFTSHNHDFNPDKILVEGSRDGNTWIYIGENRGSFINGWANVIPDRNIICRYIKITYYKTNFENWKNWLVLEDAEVLKKY